LIRILIYLDPGHGGKDPGAVGNGLKEKEIVLDICERINKSLKQYENVTVMMSRNTDVFVSLEERTKQANNLDADVFLSVHINSSTNVTAKGFETHIFPNSGSATVALQNVLHQEIYRQINKETIDRGKKQSNFHVLRDSKMKALLTENLFISNPSEGYLLSNPDFRQKLADGHVIGLEKFFGLKKKATPTPPPEKTRVYHRVIVGSFEEKTNAEALASDLRKIGYRPWISSE